MYIDSLKLLLKFDNHELFENVNQVYLNAYIDQTVSTFDNGLGYIMKQSQYIGNSNFNFDITNKFTMSFWLNPSNPGVVINEYSGEEESLEMPVFSIVRNNYPSIYLYEKTLPNTKNYLTIDVENIDDPIDPYDPYGSAIYSISTPEYDSSIWHHFFVVYASGSINIFIDGIEVATTESGICPSSVNGYGSSDFYINKNKTDIFYGNQTYNSGYIDDLAIFNDNKDISFLQNLINNSIDYAVDINSSINKEKQYGIMFDDPSTVKITSMIDDMSYIFITRNDGKIFRGSPLFWKTRKVYSNDEEFNILNENIIVSSEATEDQQNAAKATNDGDGFIHIKNSLIGL